MIYAIATWEALRDQLRCKEIWVLGADRVRNPDEDLPQDFERRRTEHYAALLKPLDPSEFIEELRSQMREELHALHRALPELEFLEIADRGKQGGGQAHAAAGAARPREPEGAQARHPRPVEHGSADRHLVKESILRTGCRKIVIEMGPRRPPQRRHAGRTAEAGAVRLRDEHRDPTRRRRRPWPRRG
jgi:hypothetical protein